MLSISISGFFLFSSTCISVANLFSLGFVFDSGFGVVLELNNTPTVYLVDRLLFTFKNNVYCLFLKLWIEQLSNGS